MTSWYILKKHNWNINEISNPLGDTFAQYPDILSEYTPKTSIQKHLFVFH